MQVLLAVLCALAIFGLAEGRVIDLFRQKRSPHVYPGQGLQQRPIGFPGGYNQPGIIGGRPGGFQQQHPGFNGGRPGSFQQQPPFGKQPIYNNQPNFISPNRPSSSISGSQSSSSSQTQGGRGQGGSSSNSSSQSFSSGGGRGSISGSSSQSSSSSFSSGK